MFGKLRHFVRLGPPVALLLLLAATSVAQVPPGAVPKRFHVLDQFTAPGKTAYWQNAVDPARRGYFQPVRVLLPSTGTVTFFSAGGSVSSKLDAPATAAVAVGHLYRLRISQMPEHPGIELYPTIEVIDRLHPPHGRAFDFPVPIPLAAEEIDAALSGRLVTKVIYLEQPQLAEPQPQQNALIRVHSVTPTQNVLAAADVFGRPIVIVRIGGRLPDPHGHDAAFFGNGPGVRLPPSRPTAGNKQSKTGNSAAPTDP